MADTPLTPKARLAALLRSAMTSALLDEGYDPDLWPGAAEDDVTLGVVRRLIAAGVTLAAPEAGLREALEWALLRLAERGYRHPDECSPTECRCGFWKAAKVLETSAPAAPAPDDAARDEPTAIATDGDRLAVAYLLRQKRRARLLCANGHEMERRSSTHLGEWSACTRCGLIEETDR